MKHILEKAKTWMRERTMRQRQIISLGLLLLFGLIGTIGLARIPTSDPLVLIGTLGMIAAILLNVCWCRCPHCGECVSRVAFEADYCPRCGGRLDKKE